MNKKQSSISLDNIGMIFSMICIVHCISIPLILIFGFGFLLSVVDQEWVEWMIIASALCIGLISFGKGFLIHRRHYVIGLFVVGFLSLVIGESVAVEWVSMSLSVLGAVMIIYAHLQNLNWKRMAYAR